MGILPHREQTVWGSVILKKRVLKIARDITDVSNYQNRSVLHNLRKQPADWLARQPSTKNFPPEKQPK